LSDKKEPSGAAAQAELTRQSFRKFLDGLEPESLELAFSEDAELTRETIESAYLVEMAWVRLIKVFARYLDSLDEAERAAVLEKHIAAVDGSQIAETLNAYSELLMKVHAENPELVEKTYPAMEAVLRGTDFGKVRESSIALLDYFTAYMTHMIEVMMDNPVVVANLVGIAPPLLNSLIKVLSVALEKTNLPPEILASALFNTLSALDAEELGRMLTTASRMAIDLHAGNYILGGEEPRFRAVFADFMKRVLDNLDSEAATGALVALAEDAETIAAVLVELVARDPEMVVLMSKTGASFASIFARVIANALAEASAWPDELLVKVGEEVRGGLEPAEVGRALDSAITLALRFRETNPELHKEIATEVLQGVNTERLELLLSSASADMKEAMLANPGVRQALEPEEMGRRVNDALARFNSSAAGRPGAIGYYMTRLLGAVDTGELETAARNVTHGMMDAVFSQRERAMALLKLGASNAWRLVKLIARTLVG
jgi:hypothetical protein